MNELYVLVYTYPNNQQIEVFETFEDAVKFGHGIWENDFYVDEEMKKNEGTFKKVSPRWWDLIHADDKLTMHIEKVTVHKTKEEKKKKADA